MAKVDIRVIGQQELLDALVKKRERLINYLNYRLLQLAEEAVTYSKEVKGYQDRTANLKNSISFALYYNGELVTMQQGHIPQPQAILGGQRRVELSIESYAQKVGVKNLKGYVLIIVAGMIYGKYVEDKGYNVLHLTKYFLKDEIEGILEDCRKEFAL